MNPMPKHIKGKSDAVSIIDFIHFLPDKIHKRKKL